MSFCSFECCCLWGASAAEFAFGAGLYREMSFPEPIFLFSSRSKQSYRTMPIQPSAQLGLSIMRLLIAMALFTMSLLGMVRSLVG